MRNNNVFTKVHSKNAVTYLILAKDLGDGVEPGLMLSLEEVSKLLEAYSSSILSPDF